MGATLCDESDIKKRLQLGDSDTLTADQAKAWPPLAEEATGLVEGFIKFGWSDTFDINDPTLTPPVPKEVRVVVSRMVVRAMTAPKSGPGVPLDGQQSSSSTFGPMSYARGFASDSVFTSPWMSKSDRLALIRFRQGNIQNVPMYDTSKVGGRSTLGSDFLDPRHGWGPW